MVKTLGAALLRPRPTTKIAGLRVSTPSSLALLKEGDELYIQLKKTTFAQKFAQEAAMKEAKPWDQIVPPHYHSHRKVFSEAAAQCFPDTRPWDHAIDLKPDAPDTLDCKVYPLGPGEQEVLQKFLKEHLDKGYVRPSKSPYASPFFFIKKKDGKLCLVQDYRKLNALMICNRYPLPLIPELIDRIRGHSLFMKLDIRWGYNNIHICDGDHIRVLTNV
jgi:hypothetical protein